MSNCQEIRLCIIMSRGQGGFFAFGQLRGVVGKKKMSQSARKSCACELWPPWLTNYQSKGNTGHVVCFSLLFSLSVEKDTFFSLHSVQRNWFNVGEMGK